MEAFSWLFPAQNSKALDSRSVHLFSLFFPTYPGDSGLQ